MVEYAIVSGKNFFNGFFTSMEPMVHPFQVLFSRVGIHLTVGEACMVIGISAAVLVGSLIMIVTK